MGNGPDLRAAGPGSGPAGGKLRAIECANALHAHAHICAKDATCGARTHNLGPCGPDHYATYETVRVSLLVRLRVVLVVYRYRALSGFTDLKPPLSYTLRFN